MRVVTDLAGAELPLIKKFPYTYVLSLCVTSFDVGLIGWVNLEATQVVTRESSFGHITEDVEVL